MMRRGATRQSDGEGDGGFAKVELMPGNVGYIDLARIPSAARRG
jgi:hypothetical protein